MPDPQRGSPSGPPLGADREVAFRKPRNWFQKHLSGIIAAGVVVVVIAAITIAFLATRNLDDVSASDPSSGVVSSSAAPSPSPSPSTSKPTTPAAPPPIKGADGTVVAVIASGKWTIALQKGINFTVVATPATKYKGAKTADDIKKNASVSVDGTLSGTTITATTITLNKKKKS